MRQALFLGRSDEQRRFESVLDAVRSSQESGGASPVLLVQGLGGIGKTTLLNQYLTLAQGDADDPTTTKGKPPLVVAVNFEDERARWPDAFPASTGPALLTVLAALHAACVTAFGDSSRRTRQANRAFEAFMLAVSQVSQMQAAAPRVGSDDELGSSAIDGTAKAVEAMAAMAGAPVPVGGIVQAVGLAARERRRAQGALTVLDVRYRPEEALARAFAAGVQTLSADRSIVFMLDTYEIVAKAGGWLRTVMKHTGARTAWVVAGRLEADADAAENSDAAAFSRELPEGSLRIVNLARFPDQTIAELLTRRNVPDLSPATVNAVAAVTHGVPLAVDLVAGLLASGAPLSDVTSAIDRAGDSTYVVTTLARRYLMHALHDPELQHDIPYLYGLALAHADQTDPQLLQALWDADGDIATQLEQLAIRHDFVLTRSRRLHVDVRDTFRSYLLDTARRAQTREANERAAALLQRRLARYAHATVVAQLEDGTWRSTVAALTWHELWIDNDRGLERLLDIFPSAALLHRPFAHELISVAGFFADTLTQQQQALLRGMSSLLSFGALLDGWLEKRREALMRDPAVVSIAGARAEPSDVDRQTSLERMAVRAGHDASILATGCSRAAIVSLLDARSTARTDPERALRSLERAAVGVPIGSGRLATELATTARELTSHLVSKRIDAGESPSPRGLLAARLATQYQDTPESWISLGLTLGRLRRDREAVQAYDELLARFTDEPDPEVRRHTAMALCNKGIVLGRLKQLEDAVATYEALAERYGDDPDPELRRQTAKGLLNRAIDLGSLERREDAIAAYDAFVARYGDDRDPELRRQTATALNNRAAELARLGREPGVVEACTAVIERYGDDPEPGIRRQMAIALLNKAGSFVRSGRQADAVALCDELVERYGDDPDPETRRRAAAALVRSALALAQLDERVEAIARNDALVERYGDDSDALMREHIASALNNNALNWEAIGRHQEAIDAYDALVARYGEDPGVDLQRRTAIARIGSGRNLARAGRLDDAVVIWDELAERLDDHPAPELRCQAAVALLTKGFELGELGHSADAIAAYDALVERYGDDPDAETRRHAVAAALHAITVTLTLAYRDEEVRDAHRALVDRYEDDPNPVIRRYVVRALNGWIELERGDGRIASVSAELLDRAEGAFERALEASPDEAWLAGHHALLVMERNDDPERAERLFVQALAIDPANGNNLANYARLKFQQESLQEAVVLADRALAAIGPGERPAAAEVWIYLLALGPETRREEARRNLAALIDEGVQSPKWDFSRILALARARGDGDPLTELLADVVAGAAAADALADRTDWPPAAPAPG